MKIYAFLLFLSAGASFARDVNTIYPYPKAAWNKPGQFIITGATLIVTSDNPTQPENNAVAALESAIYRLLGDKLSTVSAKNYSGTNSILIGNVNTFAVLRNHLAATMPPGETIPGAQGYILDISANEILLGGSDSDGIFNSVTTLAQLFDPTPTNIIKILVDGAHVWDYPDYPDRWVFSGHNLLVGSQLSALEAIADTMSLYKINGIQQNDFKYSILQLMWSAYFDNVDSLKLHLQKENIELIPGVIGIGWSSGILYNDPNLAEGLPASATYIMEADTGRLIPDPRVALINGGFENVNANNVFTDWDFYDGPNVSSFQDKTVFHSGSASAKCMNFTQGNPSGNCRFSKLLSCDSNKYYSISAWIKTQDLQGGFVQMLALGGPNGQGLTFTQLAIDPTMDWTRVEVNFNTLGNTSVRLYIGVWGGQSGTIWFDDFQIHEAGLSSVIRRDGCPLSVENKIPEKFTQKESITERSSIPRLMRIKIVISRIILRQLLRELQTARYIMGILS